MKDNLKLLGSLPAANVQSVVSFPLLIYRCCLKEEYKERLLWANILLSLNDGLQLRVKNKTSPQQNILHVHIHQQ